MVPEQDEIVAEVRARTDLVELVAEHVRLRRVGRSYVGLCPFHPEKTPSFHVSPERQLFYCFGCQTGGDAFRFVMLTRGVPFAEALRLLAERAGVPLSRGGETPARRRARAERERLLEALEWATRFYQHQLRATPAGREALAYLAARGVDGTWAERFRLGWAPADGAGLVRAMLRRGFPPETLVRAGLAGLRRGGPAGPDGPGGIRPEALYDWLRGRIVIPIADEHGRVIGFGGRVLGDGTPKYLNSPETPLFRKRAVWFALDRARAAIRREGRVLVVEGYLDAIACHRHGLEWAVASLGTSLSQEQAQSLVRLAEEIVIAYDADAAGQAATLRGIDHFRLLAPEASVRVAVLPPGEDPDSFLRRYGVEALRELIERAPDYLEYRFERLLAARGDGVTARVRVAREIAPWLAGLPSAVARDAYVRRFAERLGVSPAALHAEIRRVRHKDATERALATGELASGPAVRPQADAYWRAERELVHLLVSHPGRLADVRRHGLEPGELEEPAHAELLSALLRVGPPAEDDPEGRNRWLHRVLDAICGDEARALLSELAVRPPLGDDRDGAVLAGLIRRIRQRPLARRCEDLRRQVREYERLNQDVPAELLRTLQELERQLRGA